jgi:hypothetical protein
MACAGQEMGIDVGKSTQGTSLIWIEMLKMRFTIEYIL